MRRDGVLGLEVVLADEGRGLVAGLERRGASEEDGEDGGPRREPAARFCQLRWRGTCGRAMMRNDEPRDETDGPGHEATPLPGRRACLDRLAVVKLAVGVGSAVAGLESAAGLGHGWQDAIALRRRRRSGSSCWRFAVVKNGLSEEGATLGALAGEERRRGGSNGGGRRRADWRIEGGRAQQVRRTNRPKNDAGRPVHPTPAAAKQRRGRDWGGGRFWFGGCVSRSTEVEGWT